MHYSLMQKQYFAIIIAIISVSFASIFIRLSNENPLAIATWSNHLDNFIKNYDLGFYANA